MSLVSFGCGYIAAVVFPVPWLSALIIRLWGHVIAAIETWFKGGPVPPAL